MNELKISEIKNCPKNYTICGGGERERENNN